MSWRDLVEECDLHTHVRQHPMVSFQQAQAYPNGGFVAVCGRNDRQYGARIGAIGVGVETDAHGLLCGNAVDVGFVDIHLDFERVHVDDGADSRARKSATRRYG